MVGIENQLRYGANGKGGFGVDAVPPFDAQQTFTPREGAMVLFPPWLVHSVPPSPEALSGEDADKSARISLSFNLFGPWSATAQSTLMHAETDIIGMAAIAQEVCTPETSEPIVEAEATAENELGVEVTSADEARAEFEALLAGMGGVSQDAVRPPSMPSRRPSRGSYTPGREDL